MNITTAAREATRSPSADAVHADRIACTAARSARLLGADVATCAAVYAAAYADALKG